MRKKTSNSCSEYKYPPYSILISMFLGIISFMPVYAVDYLIVNHPQSLHILNRYEQNLSTAELSGLPKFCPMKILEENALLSDSYTTAIKIKFSGQEYYLIKDAQGNLTVTGEKTASRRYRNVKIQADTIEIIRENKYRLQTADPGIGDHINVSKNQKIKRIFSSGGKSYVQLIGEDSRFGWIDISDQRFWKKFSPISTNMDYIFKPDLTRLKRRIDQINETYARLFAVLNSATGFNEKMPSWNIEQSDKSIFLSFAPVRYQEYFSGSIAAFLSKADSILARSDLKLQPTAEVLKYEIYDKTSE